MYVKNVLVFALFSGLVVGLVVGLFRGLVPGLVVSIVAGLAYGFAFGLSDYLESDSIASIQINRPYQRFKNSAKMLYFSILQHYHLMYLFSQKGWLPWQIAPFLDDMVAQQLLESPDGATWRFRHGILQEHFAKRWGAGE